ncbi:MAG: hypothetical protein ACOCQQ_01740 [Candidatus Nanoarchaeia archaeon]
MNKLICLFSTLLIIVFLAGCGSADNKSEDNKGKDSKSEEVSSRDKPKTEDEILKEKYETYKKIFTETHKLKKATIKELYADSEEKALWVTLARDIVIRNVLEEFEKKYKYYQTEGMEEDFIEEKNNELHNKGLGSKLNLPFVHITDFCGKTKKTKMIDDNEVDVLKYSCTDTGERKENTISSHIELVLLKQIDKNYDKVLEKHGISNVPDLRILSFEEFKENKKDILNM